MNETIISLTQLSKMYRLYPHTIDRLKESLHPFRKKYHQDFFALRDISFEIRRGENIGIVGRNGSGKSTLLKIITGVLNASSGTLNVQGKISALLELGAGFNPEFTGIENVYFNGSIMGYTRQQMKAKLGEILAFADIGDFAGQPVKTYSSGMQVRLAFAVAISIDPDILIVDEALAVGDAPFQMKCIAKINEMIKKGVTLFFVSHDPGAVKRLCSRAILLEKGHLIKDGKPDEVFDLYNAMLADEEFKNTLVKKMESGHTQTVSGTGLAQTKRVALVDTEGNDINTIEVGCPTILEINVDVNEDLPRLALGFMIKDRLGQVIFGTNTSHTDQIITEPKKGCVYCFRIHFNMSLGPGDYSISTALVSSETHLENNYEWKDFALLFKVVNVHNIHFAGFNWIPAEFKIKLVENRT